MTTRYTIRDETGAAVAVHSREDMPDGDKRVWWELPDGSKGLPCPMNELPLYGSHHNIKNTVVIVEGEKCAEALWRHGVPALGTYGAGTTPADLGILAGRRVVLWPDNDDVGRSHMRRIQERVQPIASAVYWLLPPESAPEHWDAADADSLDIITALIGDAIEAGPLPVVEVSDQTTGVSVTKKPSPYRTAAEVARSTPAKVDWVAEPWVPQGATVELAGKIKASGKTTWALALARAVIHGEPFMGRPTRRGAVVFLTEQPDASLRQSLERAGLADSGSLYLFSQRDHRGGAWADVMAQAVEVARDVGAVLIVVDTLGAWAGLRGESENDAGAAQAAIAPVQAANDHGIATLVLRHERKGGGAIGESARGSSAFAGAVDIVLRLARPEGNHRPTVRRLDAIGRFDETPDELMVELVDGRYVVLGSAADLELREARDAILELSPEAMTEAQIIEAVEAPRATVRRAIAEMVAGRELARDGAGKRGKPFLFSVFPSDMSLVRNQTLLDMGESRTPLSLFGTDVSDQTSNATGQKASGTATASEVWVDTETPGDLTAQASVIFDAVMH